MIYMYAYKLEFLFHIVNTQVNSFLYHDVSVDDIGKRKKITDYFWNDIANWKWQRQIEIVKIQIVLSLLCYGFVLIFPTS